MPAPIADLADALFDISIRSDAHTAIWPGDAPYRFALNWEMSAGASVNVGTVTMSIHFGTHVDAPFHFDPNGARAGELDLAPFWGPAIVVDLSAQPTGAPLGWEHFAALDLTRTPRVLLKTNAWPDPTVFPASIPVLAVDAAERLAAGGAVLLGVDLPSVDALDDPILPIHHALDAGSVRILECLNLRDVPPGAYELVALPLRLMDADGAPVRAALRPLR